jgi:hypothetical protein
LRQEKDEPVRPRMITGETRVSLDGKPATGRPLHQSERFVAVPGLGLSLRNGA